MIAIEPLGTGGAILPAFVVGYELSGTAERLADRMSDADPVIVHLLQQAGGYCMSYPSVVGAVLRLAANTDRGFRPLDDLVRGLKAMAEDPDMHVLQDYPLLRRLVRTSGEPYGRADLHALGQYLGRFTHVPRVQSGIEAFIRFEPCDLLHYFKGWRVLTCRPLPLDQRRRGSTYVDTGGGWMFDDSNLSDLSREDLAAFDEVLVARIIDVGRRLGCDRPPGLFLLWENSD